MNQLPTSKGFSRPARHLLMAAGLAAVLGAVPAAAQSLGYGDPGDADTAASSEQSGDQAGVQGGRRGERRTTVRPYIELTQGVFARLEPKSDVVTYTSVAAGVDVALAGRRTEGTVSVRYERRFVEKGTLGSNDTFSGLARVRHDLIPHALTIEAGGLAARTRFESSGTSRLNALPGGDQISQVYSVYAGPAFNTHAGDIAVSGSYLFGYTKVNTPSQTAVVQPAQPQVDIFNKSTAHSAQVSAGFRPGTVLPVGLTASAGFNQEDISNLDQRVRDLRVGLQATAPVTRSLALIGDVGWQEVRVSARDAVRGADGTPLVGKDGRYVTDTSKPRALAYETRGLTWDVGVMWRPSRRTSLSAFVGRRYDSWTYNGSFSYVPNARSSFNLSVYDGISGFGSRVGAAVRDLPTDFESSRNPFSGDINGCAQGSQSGGCVNGALSSLSSAVFRGRGVAANYGQKFGQFRAALGAGYDRRTFIGARGTVLAAANGRVDENFYVNAGLSGPIDRLSSFSVGIYDNWFKSGDSALLDVNSVGINAGISRQFTQRLVGNVAVGLDSVNRKAVDDELVGTGLVGLRYNF